MDRSASRRDQPRTGLAKGHLLSGVGSLRPVSHGIPAGDNDFAGGNGSAGARLLESRASVAP
jgi:hypothetical protein